MRFWIPIILGFLIGIFYPFFTQHVSSEFLASILLILFVISVYEYKQKREKEFYEGYVCEICGSDYDQCEHSICEDYTLVKKY
jgi:hypothetical protein